MGGKNNKRGFTLIEIIVVVAILGILILLAALSIRPNFQLAKARDAKRKADLKKISTILEDYNNDKGCYPLVLADELPHDPKTKQSYDYVCAGEDCGSGDGCSKFAIYADLETETGTDYGGGNYVVTSPNYPLTETLPTEPPEAPTFIYGCKGGVCVDLHGENCSPKFPNYPNCDFGSGVSLCDEKYEGDYECD